MPSIDSARDLSRFASATRLRKVFRLGPRERLEDVRAFARDLVVAPVANTIYAEIGGGLGGEGRSELGFEVGEVVGHHFFFFFKERRNSATTKDP